MLLTNSFLELLNSTNQYKWYHITALSMLSHHEMSTYRYVLVNMSFQDSRAFGLLHQMQCDFPRIKLYIYGTYLLPEAHLHFDCFSELSEIYHRFFMIQQ
jgi:hypothetical protein